MENCLALVGQIPEEGKHIFYNKLGNKYHIIEVSSEEEYDKLHDANFIVLRTLRIGRKVIEACPKLKLIQRWGSGFDTVDIEASRERGVKVAITAGGNAIQVAEFSVLLILSACRNLIGIDRGVREGKWRVPEILENTCVLAGKTVGVIGMGNIGRMVSSLLKAFECRIIYFDAFRLPKETEAELGVEYRDLQKLVAESDIITVHVPKTSETESMINAEMLSLMKQSSIIVNTSRGSVIDQKALTLALQEGRIAGAGLDVFNIEPIEPGNPLLQMENVVLSAHCAGNTADNNIRMAEHCINNINLVASGNSIPQKDSVVE